MGWMSTDSHSGMNSHGLLRNQLTCSLDACVCSGMYTPKHARSEAVASSLPSSDSAIHTSGELCAWMNVAPPYLHATQSRPAPHLEAHCVLDGLGAAEPATGAAIVGIPGLVDHPAGGCPGLGLPQVVEAVGSRGVHANGEVVPKQPFHLQMGRYSVASHEAITSRRHQVQYSSCTSSRAGKDRCLGCGSKKKGDRALQQPLHLQLCKCIVGCLFEHSTQLQSGHLQAGNVCSKTSCRFCCLQPRQQV